MQVNAIFAKPDKSNVKKTIVERLLSTVIRYNSMLNPLHVCFFMVLYLQTASAEYTVSNHFEGYHVDDIALHDGMVYCSIRVDEGPTSIVRFDPGTETYSTYPDITIDERADGSKYIPVYLTLDNHGRIWCRGYGIVAYDGDAWIEKTPPQMDREPPETDLYPYSLCFSQDNEAYVHYPDVIAQMPVEYTTRIYIYRHGVWMDFFGENPYYPGYGGGYFLFGGLFDTNGDYWAFSGQYSNVFCFSDGEWREYERPFVQSVLDILEAPDGTIWTLGNISLAEFDGTEWRKYVNDDLIPYQYPSDFAVGPDGRAWMACNGCLASFDNWTWTLITEGHSLPSLTIHSIEIDNNGVLYIGTGNGLSIWTPGTVSVRESTSRANEDILHAYPNPFNSLVTLTFDNCMESRVEVNIYDILGQQIRSFEWNTVQPGVHTITWNGRNMNGEKVASGLYFAQLKTDYGVYRCKMLFAR